jgi:hypothetical protein
VPALVREFDGPHLVPEAVAAEAVRWLVRDRPDPA